MPTDLENIHRLFRDDLVTASPELQYAAADYAQAVQTEKAASERLLTISVAPLPVDRNYRPQLVAAALEHALAANKLEAECAALVKEAEYVIHNQG
jgi:hypothetical protein